MANQLTAKNGENIYHIEVPTELLHQGGKRQNTSTKEGDKPGPKAKKGNKHQGVKGGSQPNKPRVMHLWSTKLKEIIQKTFIDTY